MFAMPREKSAVAEARAAARRQELELARQRAFERGETAMERLPAEGLSTSSILNGTLAKIREMSPRLTGWYLDVGAGNGELIDRVLHEYPAVKVRACDYRADLLTIRGVAVDVVDLNAGRLPYPDDHFDLVTCTEVIEHLENYHAVLRDACRILRPGGVLIVTTPNVLNIRSRIRYLLFGFFNMFGPLRLDDDRHHSTHGHINPVGYFYLAHALSNAGFTDVDVSVDKLQRGSFLAWLLLYLPVRVYSARAKRRERSKYGTLDERNARFVDAMNRRDMLLGRTIIVGCRKPS